MQLQACAIFNGIAVSTLLFLMMMDAAVHCEIRCHCNDASCVPTGYMCKSASGQCFSRLSLEAPPPAANGRSASLATHGCAEMLTSPERHMCDRRRTRSHVARAKREEMAARWPIMLCCTTDMCNYINTLPMNINLQGGQRHNVTSADTSDIAPDADITGDRRYGYRLRTADLSQRDIWFKAAVIAVPIAGGFILVLLVLLAVRMLKHDQRRHRQLIRVSRHQRGMTKAQLFVANHFYTTDAKHVLANGHAVVHDDDAPRMDTVIKWGRPPTNAMPV